MDSMMGAKRKAFDDIGKFARGKMAEDMRKRHMSKGPAEGPDSPLDESAPPPAPEPSVEVSLGPIKDISRVPHEGEDPAASGGVDSLLDGLGPDEIDQLIAMLQAKRGR